MPKSMILAQSRKPTKPVRHESKWHAIPQKNRCPNKATTRTRADSCKMLSALFFCAILAGGDLVRRYIVVLYR